MQQDVCKNEEYQWDAGNGGIKGRGAGMVQH
jgi:hypothetical protein